MIVSGRTNVSLSASVDDNKRGARSSHVSVNLKCVNDTHYTHTTCASVKLAITESNRESVVKSRGRQLWKSAERCWVVNSDEVDLF